MAVSWRTTAFQKKRPKTPIFIVFFVFRFFGPRCKKGKFWKATPKRKKLTDNWKAIFWYFCCFFCWLLFFLFVFFFFCFCLFFCFCVLFFGGFKGQVRWPEGPPHLALNPPSFFFFCFFLFFCFFVFFLVVFFWEGLRVRWGGPKGHLTWP